MFVLKESSPIVVVYWTGTDSALWTRLRREWASEWRTPEPGGKCEHNNTNSCLQKRTTDLKGQIRVVVQLENKIILLKTFEKTFLTAKTVFSRDSFLKSCSGHIFIGIMHLYWNDWDLEQRKSNIYNIFWKVGYHDQIASD